MPADIAFTQEKSLFIFWDGSTLVIPDWLLDPVEDRAQFLMPLLARALSATQEADGRLAGFIRGLPQDIPLWLADREKLADRFAYLLGEGERLCQLLRHIHQSITPEKDTTRPTLAERIDYLEALLHGEARTTQGKQ